MMRNASRWPFFTLGATFLACGQFAIYHGEAVGALLERARLGDRLFILFPRLFPPGVAVALGVVFFGALLVAYALGLPPQQTPLEIGGHSLAGRLTLPRSSKLLLVLAGVLALLSALCSSVSILQAAAVPAWIVTFVCGCAAMFLADRARGTRFGNPFSGRWEWLALLLLVVVDTCLVAHDLTHLNWAGTPDESNFFQVAKSIATGHSDRFLLSEHGVFDYHPVLSSFYQSVFMRLFGVNVFAWRLSSAVALAGSLPFLYLLTRELWSRGAGYAAAIFFGSTQLAVGFAHFGYNNVQAYPVVLGSLGFFAWARRRRSLLGYYLAGCIAGLGFYTFQPAMLAPVLVMLLGLTLRALPLLTGDRRLTLAFVLGVAFTILPACTHFPQTVAHVVQQTGMPSGPEVRVSQLGTSIAKYLGSGENDGRLSRHWVWSIVYPFWFNKTHHFQTNPIVDPFCTALAAVGFWLGAGALWRQANARFLLLVYLLCALLVGATSPHERPPLTRLLFLSPFVAIFAAVAVDQLVRRLRGISDRRTAVAWGVGAAFVAASVLWSIAQLHYDVYSLSHGYGDGTTSELLRIARQLPPDTKLVYVQEEPTGMPSVDMVLEEYGMSDRLTYLHSSPMTGPENVEALSKVAPPFAVFTNLTRAAELHAIERIIAARFPGIGWHDSGAHRSWNIRYCYISLADAARTDPTKAPPPDGGQ